MVSILELRKLVETAFILWIFTAAIVAVPTDTVPQVDTLDPTKSPDAVTQERVALFFPTATLNAALAAEVVTDVVNDSLACDQPIAVTGSLYCLQTYNDAATNNLNTHILPYNETVQCQDGYEIGAPCAGSVAEFANPVTSNISVINDGLYDIAWAHEIQTNQPVRITMDFPEPFQLYGMLLTMETLPIEMLVWGSLGGSELTWLTTFQLECEMGADNCQPYVSLDTMLLFIVFNIQTFEPFTLDKLVIELPAETTWKDYVINYWLIKEIYVIAECVCSRGTCSTDIVTSDPRSVAAMYSCECPSDYSGLHCDLCADSSYNVSGTCMPCQCDKGAVNASCDSNGACECDSSLYDNTDNFETWNKKCEPYISNISPLAGPVKGGTRVTLTGGMLSQLKLSNCEPAETSETQIVCSTSPGDSIGSKVALVSGYDSLGQEITYNFTYTDNYEVFGIFPLEAFSGGGRILTIQGRDLHSANPVELKFHVECLFTLEPQSFSFTSSECQYITNTEEVHCESPSFCEVRNECRERGSTYNAENCFQGSVDDSIAGTIDFVRIEVQVVVDGQAEPNTNQFVVLKDPRIFIWENSLRTIAADEMHFTVPGENLNSGAEAREYTICVNGAIAQAVSVTATTLTVMWPSNQPTGDTNVSVGYITEDVGNLKLEETITAAQAVNLEAAIASPIVVLVVLVVVVVLLVFCWKKRSKLAIEKNFLKMAEKPGNVRYIKHNGEMSIIPLGRLVSDLQLIEQLKPFLIEQERLSLSSQLGAGQFGKVFQGTIKFDDGRQITVAAKTLKLDAGVTEETVTSFLKEATLMSSFDHHNVLSLIGVVYAEGNMPVVVLPFMHRGDIRALVHSEDEVFVLGDLLHFCMQIARGMQYLAERRFIHRDLAARNCMVDQDYVVKIADFGLSHDIYEDDYYRTDENSSKPLPVKWMAVESLNAGKFTTESDVWSYGVVMWELVTRGVTPYPLVSNYEIKSHLNGGYRLEQPEYCPTVIYEMMKTCWLTDPKSRPLFSELADKLSAILTESNYEERSKTRNIKSDYYLQETTRDDLQQLYVHLAEEPLP